MKQCSSISRLSAAQGLQIRQKWRAAQVPRRKIRKKYKKWCGGRRAIFGGPFMGQVLEYNPTALTKPERYDKLYSKISNIDTIFDMCRMDRKD